MKKAKINHAIADVFDYWISEQDREIHFQRLTATSQAAYSHVVTVW
jgi:hypothetical protein